MKKLLSILLATVLLAGFGVVGAFAYDYKVYLDQNADGDTVSDWVWDDYLEKTMFLDLLLPSMSVPPPSRIGYAFGGWAETPTGAKKYDAGDTYDNNYDTLNTTQTLYAVWVSTSYPVTFNGNPPPGGTVGGLPAAQTKLKDSPLVLSSTVPVCTGADYAFVGWTLTPGPGGTGTVNYMAGGGVLASTNTPLALYAVWEPNAFPITYNGNAPTGTVVTGEPAAETKTRNVPWALSDEIPVCKVGAVEGGYTFLNWNTAANGSGISYSPAELYNLNAELTLYAIWQGIAYTVAYNVNGGTGTTMTPSAHVYGTAKALTTNTYTNVPATFAGWAETPTGAVRYTNGQTVNNLTPEAGGVVTLYAKWTSPSKTALKAKIEEVDKLEAWKYTALTWADLQKALDDGSVVKVNGVDVSVRAARAVYDDPNATQEEIDNAAYALKIFQQKLEDEKLVGLGSLTTKYKSSLPNWLLFIFAFGWIWMWFV